MSQPEPDKPSRRPPQFSLGSLFLVTTMFAVLAAAFGAMWRAHRESAFDLGFSALMAVAAPVGVLIVVSLLYSVAQWLKRRR